MTIGSRALDLSFADELPQPCARILVVRPALDRDDAVTLNRSARTFSEFEQQLKQLETDIQFMREEARTAFHAAIARSAALPRASIVNAHDEARLQLASSVDIGGSLNPDRS